MNPLMPVILIIGIIMAASTPKDRPPKMDPNCQSRVNPAYVQWKAEQKAKKRLPGRTVTYVRMHHLSPIAYAAKCAQAKTDAGDSKQNEEN